MIARLRRWGDRWAWRVSILGLAAMAAYNWRLWQHDKALLRQKVSPVPLPPLERWPDLPQVSVLVAAWNESEHIDRHVQSFLGLRYPHKELLLCAGGTDDTFVRACRYAGPQVKVLEQRPGEGKQRALTRSFHQTIGSIIYLTDADCRFDSESFERLIYPLASQHETVVTGVSRPLQEQLGNPFIHYQSASRRYGEVRSVARYATGLLGRNCALMRHVIEEAWTEKAEIPTGTDYYLALRALKAGHQILWVSESQVETEFPESLSLYIRQQTRWLRNLLLLGYRFDDRHHVKHALFTALVGVSMLIMPLMPLLLGTFGFSAWLLAWSTVAVSRMRYVNVLNTLEGKNAPLVSLNLFRIMIGDFIAWASVFIDIWHPNRRKQW